MKVSILPPPVRRWGMKTTTTIMYGAAGALGSTLSRRFAADGAQLFLTGRTLEPVERLAKELGAEAAQVDALDPAAVAAHLDHVARRTGGVDVSVNAIGVGHRQGVALLDLTPAEFEVPVAAYTRSQFVTATAAARHMTARGAGVILTLSATASRRPEAPSGGFGTACAAVEAFTLQLGAEVQQRGVRVVCLRPDAIPQTADVGSHAADVWRAFAAKDGVPVDEWLAGPTSGLAARALTLDEVADAAAYLCRTGSTAITTTVLNLSRGVIVG